MDIRCPKCDFSRHVPNEAISPDMTIATCPKCGERFRFKEQEDFSFSNDAEDKREAASTAPTEPPRSVVPEPSAPSVSGEQPAPENGYAAQHAASPENAEPAYHEHTADGEQSPSSSMNNEESGYRPDHGQYAEDADAQEYEEEFLLPPDTPWGMIKEMGFFPAFTTTIKAVMFAPRHLFAAMRKDGPFAMPFTFYLLASMVGILFETAWQKAIGNPLLPEQLNGSGMTLDDFLITLVFSPVALSVYLYLIGGLIHLCLMLTGGGKGGLSTTLRVISYSSALDVLGVIPVIGSFIGGLWKLYTLAVGLRVAHNASKAQIIPAMLLLFLLLLVMAGTMLKSMGIF